MHAVKMWGFSKYYAIPKCKSQIEYLCLLKSVSGLDAQQITACMQEFCILTSKACFELSNIFLAHFKYTIVPQLTLAMKINTQHILIVLSNLRQL